MPARPLRQNLLAMAGLCLVLILVALDQTIVSTALPTIVAELHGFDLYAWVGTAYLLTSIVTVPIFGKLGDEYGRKPFVLVAIAVFTLASMLCGLSQSMFQLVLARGLQGIGGGMLVATTFACIPDLFPEPAMRLRWQVLFSASFGVANALGPSLGGFATEHWGWRSVFFLNLPVGLASIYFVGRHLPLIRHGTRAPGAIDWAGAALVALCLGSLQLLVEWWPTATPRTTLLALGLCCLAALSGLLWWERRSANPVLPLGLMTDPRIAPLMLLSLAMGFCMFAVMYYAPLMFQGGFGLSPSAAGMLVTPLAVFITVGSITNGRIVTRLAHPHRMLYVGVGLFWLGALGLTQVRAATSHAVVTAVMICGGLGLGMLLPNLTLFTQQLAARTQLGVATAMLQATRMIGGMLGTALVGTLVSHRYAADVRVALRAQHAETVASALDNPRLLVDPAGLTTFTHTLQQAGQDAASLVAGARTALVDAIHQGQWCVVLLMALMVWLVRRVPAVSLRAQPSATSLSDAQAPTH